MRGLASTVAKKRPECEDVGRAYDVFVHRVGDETTIAVPPKPAG